MIEATNGQRNGNHHVLSWILKIVTGALIACIPIALCWGVVSITKNAMSIELMKHDQQTTDKAYDELRKDAQKKYDELISRCQRIEAKLLIIERKLPDR